MSAVSPNQARTPRKPPIDLTPPEQAIAETIEWVEPERRRSGRSLGSSVLATLAILLAAGAGYVAWEQSQARQSALATLSKTSAELRTVAGERASALENAREQESLVAQQKDRLAQSDAELSELKVKLGAAEARLAELANQSEALNQHLTEFRALTKQFQRMIDSGKLQITYRRGRMIVELPAAVLFASGSAELSTDGRQALQEIAKILRKVPGKRFVVGGHTDDVPIGKASSTYSSNWSLSAARAVVVTEALLQSGLRPGNLVAAGFGEYDPIANNANERGRVKNRRIEIVLEPNIAGLPHALAELQDAAETQTKSKPLGTPTSVAKR